MLDLKTLIAITLMLETAMACDCDDKHFSSSVMNGSIESPNYPADYCNNLNCVYSVDAKPGWVTHLMLEAFATEYCCDKLTVLESRDGSIQEVAR